MFLHWRTMELQRGERAQKKLDYSKRVTGGLGAASGRYFIDTDVLYVLRRNASKRKADETKTKCKKDVGQFQGAMGKEYSFNQKLCVEVLQGDGVLPVLTNVPTNTSHISRTSKPITRAGPDWIVQLEDNTMFRLN
jgi:hypothetical protein